MRDVAHIWDAWRSGAQVGERAPCTRVTVEKGWRLRMTDSVVGLWANGPARWFLDEDPALRVETEVPNVISVNISRTVSGDAGTCDITIVNTEQPRLGQAEVPPGQFGTPGYLTWDHGQAQDARARWQHTPNPWNDVLVPNALIRTYQGFGGHQKTLNDAVADGNLVLNGVWLIDDVTINTEGTISVKCRDMMKLLIDQQLFPPLVPTHLYPLLYQRWIVKNTPIPTEPVDPTVGGYCNPCRYHDSSTDQAYGQFNTGATGHAPGEAFDISGEVGPPVPGFFTHQRTYWLSEPKGSPSDTVWVEFDPEGGLPGDINEIYYHAWSGNYRVMVSVQENGTWVAAETSAGGVTPEGVPYVGTFTPAVEGGPVPGLNSNRYPLPRDYRAERIRLTITNLVLAPEGGFRAGARKIMACFSVTNNADARIPPLVFASASIPVNDDNRQGYWQVKANGQVYAFGDARAYPANSPASQPASTVVGMEAHPAGNGYWYVDITGRVVSAGDATWEGDLADAGITDVVDIAPTPSGAGYWLLRSNGAIHSFGDAIDQGVGSHSATLPSGADAIARSLASHPASQGYWILYADGTVQAFGAATHYGNANRTGFTTAEYVGSIRRTSTGLGYWITSGNGIVQAFGDAPHRGNANPPGTTYAGDKWFRGIVWDLIPSPVSDNAYAIQRADGNMEVKGGLGVGEQTGLQYGSIGSGRYELRYDGNYRDYADIIRELLLWAGYLLHKTPQPGTERPDIYGNIENTGAWSETDLPIAMFDKKPVVEAINELKDVVGYAFFVDAEGGARFESPNWWGIGNFLINGTPYNHIPEIDESVNLTSHSITFNAASARSELIIATEDPQPKKAGQEPSKGITQTRIVPKSEPDLRGLVVPAMWTNGKFLNSYEQRVMADLIDMRMWFSRRTAQITCVGNPLIDVNDQIRVIERQTGEVFVHYVKAIDFSHDLRSGDYNMSLTTHWLGGTPFGRPDYYLACAMMPGGAGYWQCTISGQIYAFGDAQIYERHQDDSHIGWVTGFRPTPSGQGYYSVDQHGKVLTYGDAIHRGNATPATQPDTIPASVPINDMAMTPSGEGYWLLEQDGTIWPFGDAMFYGSPTNGGRRLPSGSLVYASAIESHPTTQGYWVLWSDGVVDAFNLPDHGDATRGTNNPSEAFTVLRSTVDGGGYWIVSAGGDNLQAFGNATALGAGEQYSDDRWTYGLVWDMLVQSDGGYALQRADGILLPYEFADYGPVPIAPVEAFWALVPEGTENDLAFTVSAELMNFLANTASPSANNAVANGFAAPTEGAIRGAGT